MRSASPCWPRTAPLNYYQPHIDTTQDWNRIDVTFNSLEFSQLNSILGVWGGKAWHHLVGRRAAEPGGLVNVVRRDGAPLRATSEDGRTRYHRGGRFPEGARSEAGHYPLTRAALPLGMSHL